MANKDQWQILTRFPNGDELSTVKLPKPYSHRYESCMFYANGDSNVVRLHYTQAEAVEFHTLLVSHELAHDMAKRQLEIS